MRILYLFFSAVASVLIVACCFSSCDKQPIDDSCRYMVVLTDSVFSGTNDIQEMDSCYSYIDNVGKAYFEALGILDNHNMIVGDFPKLSQTMASYFDETRLPDPPVLQHLRYTFTYTLIGINLSGDCMQIPLTSRTFTNQ